MTTPGTDQNAAVSPVPDAGPTYADAVERASAALMFREPVLARTGKTARAIAERVIDALIAADCTKETVAKPAAAQQQSMSEFQ